MSDSTTTATKQQNGGVSTVPLTHPDSHNDSSNSSDSFVELSFHEDAISLQDLIDSELALRVSTDTIEDDVVEEIPVEAPVPIKLDLLDLKVADEDLSDSPEHKPVPRADEPSEPHSIVDEDLPSEFSLPDRLPPNSATTIDSQIYDDILDSLKDDTLDSLDVGVIKTDLLVDDTSQDFDSPVNTLSSSSADTPVQVVESPGKPPADDVNTLFILAEQQGELTQADILFYNTFNQVQSNGDDFLSSPEAVNSEETSPKSVGFDPFATIAVPELESPSVDSVPLVQSLDEEPVVESPLVRVESPVTEPESSLNEPGSPLIEPEMPLIELEQSFIEPDVPPVEPESPVTDPESLVTEPDSPLIESAPAFPDVIPELHMDEFASPGSPEPDLGTPGSDPSASISEKQSPVFETSPPISETDCPLFEADDDAESPLFEPLPAQNDPFAQATTETIPVLPSETEEIETKLADNNLDTVETNRDLFDTNYSSFETNLVEVSAANSRNLCETAAAANAVTMNGTQSHCVVSNGITSNGVKTNGITSNGLCPIVVVDDEDFEMPSSPEHDRSDNSVNEEKKKKKKSDGGETKTKRTKKTKKEEKENISVDSQFGSASSTPSEVLLEDAGHLSNVSVKELTHSYRAEAEKSFSRSNSIVRERPKTGVSILQLRRSFGDLTNLDDLDTPENDRDSTACKSLEAERKPPTLSELKLSRRGGSSNVAWRARSLGDLRSFPAAFRSNSSFDREKPPIHTGISVMALAANYCNVVQRKDVRPLTPPAPPSPEKSSFSKFDALSKKTVLHVRSGDASKAQKQFSQASSGDVGSSACRSCGKQVFQMEQVKAERSVWHKNCFRCHDCNKQLTVDIYSSHEGVVYCKPHFKELFKPKAVVEDEVPVRRRKAGPIICENQPAELPPEVVRGSDKPDLGLEELSQLNVKSRFQAFEKAPEEAPAVGGAVSVKRSPSILSKLARFQAGAGGGDVGVADSALNGSPPSDESSSEEEEEGEEEGRVVRANRKQKERPVTFTQMSDVKGRWEAGTTKTREERREERKQEISTIRSRLFQGHQGKMKEAYQAAVSEATAAAPGKRDVEVGGDRARFIKERFERGQVNDDDEESQPKGPVLDEDLVDAGYSKKSRSLFLELDASAAKTATASPVAAKPLGRDESFRNRINTPMVARQSSQGEVVRASDATEEVRVATAEIGNKFKFFETYQPEAVQRRTFRITPPRDGTVKGGSPEREIYRDPTIVRGDDPIEETQVLRSQTASKMLSFFKHMEAAEPDKPQGLKPLKRFTPPPDCELNRNDSESSEEEGESSEEGEDEEEDDGHDPSIVRASDKMEDAFLKEAQSAAVRAKSLRAKFERWEEREIEREKASAELATPAALDGDTPSLDTTRSLRARFESMSHEVDRTADKQPRAKVNRFVEIQTSTAEFCSGCDKKVYHLEKVETGGKIFHKNCFRCMQCNCVLRMDTYTLNGGRLYCLPHFKQGFFTRGNYDEGFGADQHKRKWASDKRDNDILLSLTVAADR